MSQIIEYGIVAAGLECQICLEEFEQKNVAVSHHITHLFHKACLQQWTNGKRHPTCPCCRIHIIQPGHILPGGNMNRRLLPVSPNYHPT